MNNNNNQNTANKGNDNELWSQNINNDQCQHEGNGRSMGDYLQLNREI